MIMEPYRRLVSISSLRQQRQQPEQDGRVKYEELPSHAWYSLSQTQKDGPDVSMLRQVLINVSALSDARFHKKAKLGEVLWRALDRAV